MTDKFPYKKGRGEFIDPENVGSFVRYYLEASVTADKHKKKSGRINLNIGIGECTRSISWGVWASGDDFVKDVANGKAKIQRAINVLEEAYRELHRAAEVIRRQVALKDKKK